MSLRPYPPRLSLLSRIIYNLSSASLRFVDVDVDDDVVLITLKYVYLSISAFDTGLCYYDCHTHAIMLTQLDPNRVLDIVLEQYEANVLKSAHFIPIIKSYVTGQSSIASLVGFKFQSYHVRGMWLCM